VLFSTGVSAMGAEMLIIFSFQVIYGYVYLKIGAIVSVFLIGLLPGSAVGNLFKDKNRNRLILSEIILLCLLLLFYVWIGIIKTELHQLFFLGYCFAFSFVCGFQFPVITILIGEKQSPAAGCIAADLAGAAIGTLVVGTLLIPFWGVQSAIFFLLSIKLLSSMIIMFQGKREY
jgi:spermidine synthase